MVRGQRGRRCRPATSVPRVDPAPGKRRTGEGPVCGADQNEGARSHFAHGPSQRSVPGATETHHPKSLAGDPGWELFSQSVAHELWFVPVSPILPRMGRLAITDSPGPWPWLATSCGPGFSEEETIMKRLDTFLAWLLIVAAVV